MENSKLSLKFCGIFLILGVLLLNGGVLIRPVSLPDSFAVSSFEVAHANESLFIWSYRFSVFGMFILIMGLVALRSLLKRSVVEGIISAGILVCCLAFLVAALGEAYYMHMGAWGGWKLTILDVAVQNQFIESMDVTREWVFCFTRMSHMFLCLGLLVLGFGLLRDARLPKYLALFAIILGFCSIVAMLVFDSNTDIFKPISWLSSLFFMISGYFVLTNRINFDEE